MSGDPALADLAKELDRTRLLLEGAPIDDGEIHRVPVKDGKKGDKPGWYAVTSYENGLIYASYGDWSSGSKYKWSSRGERTLTTQEKAAIELHRAKVKAERERVQTEAAQEACRIWEAALPAPVDHPYLVKKQVQPYGLRVASDGRLIIPVFVNGQISSLQYIDGNGVKLFLTGGKTGGGTCYHPGAVSTAVVCEGFATAATIAQATGFSVYVAFNAGNLEKVVAQVKGKHLTLIIAGDDDKWKAANTGRPAAEAAAQKHGCKVVFPTCSSEASQPTDFNDMAQIDGLDAVKAVIIGEQPPEQPAIRAVPFKWREPKTIPPRRWIYDKHYIRQFVSVTGGVGGAGKSTIQIAEALAIATGKPLLGKEPAESCRVWYINLEDPTEEIDRRIMAAVIHYGLQPSDLEGRLFKSSGRDARFVMATDTADGIQFIQPNIEAFERQIEAYRIGVVIMDPFVKLHRVPENSNDAIDTVVTEIARVGDEQNCAMELPHHLRKSNGIEPTVDDIRGAGALLGAVRSARIVVPMTESEYGKAGVKEHRRRYLRVIDGKGNMAPPSDQSDWYYLESHDLGNATSDRDSDWVGVATEWTWPDAFDGVTAHHANLVRSRVGDGSYRKDPQASDWVGYVVADVLDLDLDDQAEKSMVQSIVKKWLANGVLKIEERTDESRKKRKFVVPGSTVPGSKSG